MLDMITHYERRLEERRIIQAETKGTIIISVALLISTLFMGIAAYIVKPNPGFSRDTLEELWMISNIVIVMLTVIVLAVRKTIYYSPKVIKENFTLTRILRKWKTLDLTLLAITGIIPILGLIISLFGMPFSRTYHYFVASALLMVILMPIGLKVRSKLTVLKQHTSRDWSLK